MDLFRIAVGLVLILTLYMLPAGVALLLGHKDSLAIFTLNFFLGWTFVGWILSLVWALKK